MTIALVLGSAASVFDDVEAALQMGEFDAVIGCNHIGLAWPGVMDAWVSLHGDKLLKPWVERRRRSGLPAHSRLMTMADTDHRFPGQTEPGSSGLFALKVALIDLGYDRAVLCGVPMTVSGSHFDWSGPWRPASDYHIGWRQALPHIADRCRSMGGWTADLLSQPDAAWIAGD